MPENAGLIFFDIDGTLITESHPHRVPESTTFALKRLKEEGYICLINTGRTYAGLDELIKSIQVDGYVCGCGTNIRVKDEVLLTRELSREMCTEIAETLDRFGYEWILEGERELFYSPRTYTSFLKEQVDSLREKVGKRIRVVYPEEYGDLLYTKFVMIAPDKEEYERFRGLFEGRLDFIDRGRDMYEVIPAGFSKATGMKFCEEYYGIDHGKTVAVGDSPNDLTMLEYAGTGILMGNAPEHMRACADHVTDDIEKDGLYKAFVELKMI